MTADPAELLSPPFVYRELTNSSLTLCDFWDFIVLVLKEGKNKDSLFFVPIDSERALRGVWLSEKSQVI